MRMSMSGPADVLEILGFWNLNTWFLLETWSQINMVSHLQILISKRKP